MLLFIPVKTDAPVRRIPHVNRTIIALNVLVFFVFDALGGFLGGDMAEMKRRLVLDPMNLHLYQFFTYQFLHGDLVHLGGNMLFLWIFGNGVNSKLGHLAYLFFYLAAGVFAGVGFAMTSTNPCLGASGAIAGVTTAFLVLFPYSTVTVFYWLWFYLGTMHIQAMLLIVAKVILWDNIISPHVFMSGEYEAVAYSAHLSGYFFGFLMVMIMLLIRAVPRDQFDILAVVQRYRRREEFRSAFADPDAQAQAMFGRVARTNSLFKGRSSEISAEETEMQTLRADISRLIGENDYASAAQRYEELTAKDPEQYLSRANMLLIANQFASTGKYSQAAAAYEKYIKAYPRESDVLQVKCMLGIIYAKYLAQNGTAEPLLRECVSKSTDEQQRTLAQQWLDVVMAALRPSAG